MPEIGPEVNFEVQDLGTELNNTNLSIENLKAALANTKDENRRVKIEESITTLKNEKENIVARLKELGVQEGFGIGQK